MNAGPNKYHSSATLREYLSLGDRRFLPMLNGLFEHSKVQAPMQDTGGIGPDLPLEVDPDASMA